jgi:hypothetical protein
MIPFDRTRLNSGWRQFQVMVSETTPSSVGRYAKAVINLAGVEELFPPPTVLWFSNRIENAALRVVNLTQASLCDNKDRQFFFWHPA